jgi:hypothetical protein
MSVANSVCMAVEEESRSLEATNQRYNFSDHHQT